MDFEALVKSLTGQLTAVLAAPIPFAVAVLLVAIILWRLAREANRVQREALESRLKLRDDEIGGLKDELAETKAKLPQKGSDKSSAPLTAPTEEQRRVRALATIERAIEDIESARADGSFTRLPRLAPQTKAALSTANKVFGIPRPPVRAEHADTMGVVDGLLVLRATYPLLEEGHYEEARHEAQVLLDQLAEARVS